MRLMHINGKFTQGHTTEAIEVRNPATEEVLDTVPKLPYRPRRLHSTAGGVWAQISALGCCTMFPKKYARGYMTSCNCLPSKRASLSQRTRKRSSGSPTPSITTPNSAGTSAAASCPSARNHSLTSSSRSPMVWSAASCHGTIRCCCSRGRWRPRSPPATRSSSSLRK